MKHFKYVLQKLNSLEKVSYALNNEGWSTLIKKTAKAKRCMALNKNRILLVYDY